MEILYFDKTDFKNTIINDSIRNETIDFRDFIRAFTAKNSENNNIKIVIKYAGTLENAIDIYQRYYRFIIEIDEEDVINYSDMAYVILYEYFFNDILSKILEHSLTCSE
uniref:Uncharacterized protein n=1 Tax=viral metagenome TaxID=1070528 RepID=A0A6C0ENZ3_9ZZZZ